MSIADFPDFDAGTIWQGAPLYAQIGGNIPAAGTILYQGPITSFPSILIRCFSTQGGWQLHLTWYLDSAFTLNSGSDDFHIPQGQGLYALYEVQAPFVQIKILNVTVSPAAQGEILLLPTRAPALGLRPLVTPQTIVLDNVTIPATTTLTFLLKWIVIGDLQWKVIALSAANSVTALLDTLNYDGSENAKLFPNANLIAGATIDQQLPSFPVRLQVTNTTGAPVTLSSILVSQQQGW